MEVLAVLLLMSAWEVAVMAQEAGWFEAPALSLSFSPPFQIIFVLKKDKTKA